MKVGAFTTVAWLGGTGERYLEMDDYAGLAHSRPVTAACLSIFLLSLLGFPVTAGFLGKFYIFDAALHSHLVWLAVLLAINSVIGAYYYLRVIVAMYMRRAEARIQHAKRFPPAWLPCSTLAVAGILYLGLFPNRIMDLATQAATTAALSFVRSENPKVTLC